MSELTLAILLAGVFIFGCAAIYELQRHATVLTPPLMSVALCLMVLIGLMSLATPGGDRRHKPPVALLHR